MYHELIILPALRGGSQADAEPAGVRISIKVMIAERGVAKAYPRQWSPEEWPHLPTAESRTVTLSLKRTYRTVDTFSYAGARVRKTSACKPGLKRYPRTGGQDEICRMQKRAKVAQLLMVAILFAHTILPALRGGSQADAEPAGVRISIKVMIAERGVAKAYPRQWSPEEWHLFAVGNGFTDRS